MLHKLNLFVILGRIDKITELNNNEIILRLKVKDVEDTQKAEDQYMYVEVKLKGRISTVVQEKCNKLDLISIKGQIEEDDGKTILVANQIAIMEAHLGSDTEEFSKSKKEEYDEDTTN